ncbi:MAG: galactitol-1-phosphate 5-dehydrogenase [Acetatifactor sp.]|nr:galactitol-1-phosphate 5-dehydrogenase [Acetatifactor sp.]
MKAWVLHGINDIRYEEVTLPVPGENEVLVAVKSAGICGSDIPRIYKNGAHVMPLIPGHEFSGQVVDVCNQADQPWIGKRVGVFPLIPCRKCRACLNKKYEMCEHYSYLGSRRNGGFAEYVSVPKWNLIELTDEVSYDAAAMLEPMAVAAHAMRRLSISNESSVAVCGLGTVGLLLVMLLLERGFKNIYAIGSKEIQKKMAVLLGVPEENCCDCRIDNVNEFIAGKTGHRGVDAFFECVGKNETITEAVEFTAAGGQICFVGNPYTDLIMDKNVYWKILRNQLTITGTWNSSYLGQQDTDAAGDDWNYVLNRLKDHRIHPEKLVTHSFELNELNQGFDIMRNKTEDYIKILYRSL